MICKNCGSQIPDNSRFCTRCGSKTEEKAEGAPSTGIKLCEDGKYRWIYELSMLKNPVILLTVWKIVALVFGGIGLFDLLISLKDIIRRGDPEDFDFVLGFIRSHIPQAKALITCRYQ